MVLPSAVPGSRQNQNASGGPGRLISFTGLLKYLLISFLYSMLSLNAVVSPACSLINLELLSHLVTFFLNDFIEFQENRGFSIVRSTGLVKNCSAPSFMACTAVPISPKAVRTITGVEGDISLSFVKTSKLFILDFCISKIMAGGFNNFFNPFCTVTGNLDIIKHRGDKAIVIDYQK